MASKKKSDKKLDKSVKSGKTTGNKQVSPRPISAYGGGRTGTPLTGMGTGDGRG